MSDLREAAQLMLDSVEQMLSGGEWYCARERAEALRDLATASVLCQTRLISSSAK